MANGFRWRDGQLWLAKQKDPLNIRWSRHFSGEPSRITVSRDTAGRYHVSFLVEEAQAAMPLNVRTWDCPACGTRGIDRDVNAARNILQAGKALLVGADMLRHHEKTTVGHTGG